MKYIVYILKNHIGKKGLYYISVTTDLDARIEEHELELKKLGESTVQLEVVKCFFYANALAALQKEKELKGMTKRQLAKAINEPGP